MFRYFPIHHLPPPLKFLEMQEHFVPFHVDVLLERMLTDQHLTEGQASQFHELRNMLANRFHYEYRKTLEMLKKDFAGINPEPDTRCQQKYSVAELDEKCTQLDKGVKYVLARSNFAALTPEQLDACLELQPVGGLSVYVDKQDFSKFDVFFRGIRDDTVKETRFFFLKREWKTKVFSRVVVIARSSGNDKERLIIKIFKDVSVENLKIIVPRIRLGMPVFDRLKISGTVFGSLVTPLSKLLFAFMLSWWWFIVVTSGFMIAMFKGIFSFLNSRTKYLHVFSSQLYYLTLSNNEAALTSLVDIAEEQELKETLLAYFMLFILRDRNLTMQQIDDAVERWLKEQFGFDVDFEVDDALHKLSELGLLILQEPYYKVYDLPCVLRRLDEAWDNFFTYHDSGIAADDRVADGDFPPFP